MRPRAIDLFEKLFFASVALSIVQLVLQGRVAPSEGLSEGAVAAMSALGIGLSVLLGLLASRRRSNIARWLLALLTALGLAVTLSNVFSGFRLDLPTIVGLAGMALQVAAVTQLFGEEGRAWFAGRLGTAAGGTPPEAL